MDAAPPQQYDVGTLLAAQAQSKDGDSDEEAEILVQASDLAAAFRGFVPSSLRGIQACLCRVMRMTCTTLFIHAPQLTI